MLRLTPALLASAIAAAPLYTLADTDSAQTDATDPLQVLVTGTRSEQPAGTTPGQIDVISRAQIDASGATSVTEVLRASGAVQITQNYTGNSNGGVVSMRGFGENASENTLILVDGRPLNNPTLEAPNLSLISLHDVERIEILHGSAGVLYGQHAVGGVINIITRGIEATRGEVSTGYGSYNHHLYHGSFSHRAQSGIGVRVSADSNQSDGYRDNSDSDLDRLGARFSYRYRSGEIGYSHETINDNQRLPGALSTAEVSTDRRGVEAAHAGDYTNTDTRVDRLDLTQTLTDNLQLDMEWSSRDSNGKADSSGYLFDQDTRVSTLTPRIQGQWDSANGPILLTLGADLANSDYQAYSSTDTEQNSRAGYLRLITPVTRQLSVTLGGRQTLVKDIDLANSKSHSSSAFVKELGLNWQLDPRQRLFLRRDENVRFASVDENGFTLSSVDFLKPQTGASWELGWDWQQPNTQITASLYRLDLDNEIMYDPEISNPASWSGKGANINLDSSRRQGLIVSLEQRVTDSLRVGGTYTRTDSELTAGTFKGNEVPYVARNQLSLYGHYRIDDNWSLYLDGQYCGERYRASDNANSQSRLADVVVLNSTLRWQQGRWHARLHLNNLLNEKYYAYAGYSSSKGDYYYPAPERNLMLSVGYTF